MTDGGELTYFFVHVMKTGGTSFMQHLESNFPPEQRYPAQGPGSKRQQAYYLIDELRTLTPEQRSAIRMYAGHFPYVASALVGADVTLTILRDPVERIVSMLRHRKRLHREQRDLTLEEIYDDPWVFPLYLHDYQAKLYAMTSEDKLESHLDVIEVDEARLRTAVANLERVDVLGLSDRYAEFTEQMARRFGWRFAPVPDINVSREGWDVSPAFRRRIAADNAADLAFFEHARGLYERRRRAA
jgi:hypothetical protein